MKGTVLLFGYSYYDKYYLNPAEEIVKNLHGLIVDGYVLEGMVLPVSVKKVMNIVAREIMHRDDVVLVIGLGMSPIIDSPVLELAFTNIMFFNKPDIDGNIYRFIKIIDDGPFVVTTNLPFKEIYEHCNNIGAGIRPGLSSGTYLCNILGYLIAYYTRMRGIKGGFIHVPPHTDLAMKLRLTNYRSLNLMIDTIICTIKASLEIIEKTFE